MQETEITEWLESFRAGGHGWEFSTKLESGYEIFITRSSKQTV